MFADEPTDLSGRRFDCGWGDRRQTAADIAAGLQDLARRLGTIDPAFGLIRPDPGMRKFRAGDPGPIIEMTPTELTEMIERRGRFDPPRFPGAVSSQGYSMLFRNDRLGGLHVSVNVGAGVFEYGANRNESWVWPDVEHPIWRDPELGMDVLKAMVEIWDAEWAIAFAYPYRPPPVETPEGPTPIRPWLAWTAKPLQPRPNPPYLRPYPSYFPLDHAGPPAEVMPWRSGELCIWP